MSLKEKFDNIEICIESQLLYLKYDENMQCSNNCEEIADEYAIKFAMFCFMYDRKYPEHNFDTTQLLEIFKKEKGL